MAEARANSVVDAELFRFVVYAEEATEEKTTASAANLSASTASSAILAVVTCASPK